MSTGNATFDIIFALLSLALISVWIFFLGDGTKLHRLYLKSQAVRAIVTTITVSPLFALSLMFLAEAIGVRDDDPKGFPMLSFVAIPLVILVSNASRRYIVRHATSKTLPNPDTPNGSPSEGV